MSQKGFILDEMIVLEKSESDEIEPSQHAFGMSYDMYTQYQQHRHGLAAVVI